MNLFKNIVEDYINGLDNYAIYSNINIEIKDDERDLVLNCLSDICATKETEFPLIPILHAKTKSGRYKYDYYFKLGNRSYSMLCTRAFQVLYFIYSKYTVFDEVISVTSRNSKYAESITCNGFMLETILNSVYKGFYKESDYEIFYQAMQQPRYFHFYKIIPIDCHFLGESIRENFGNGTEDYIEFIIKIK